MTFLTFLITFPLLLYLCYYIWIGRYAAKIKKYYLDLEVRKIQLSPKAKLPLENIEVIKAWLNRDLSQDAKPHRKEYQTKEIPQQVGLAMHVREWHVMNKNKNAIDVDFEVVEN